MKTGPNQFVQPWTPNLVNDSRQLKDFLSEYLKELTTILETQSQFDIIFIQEPL